MAAGVDGARMLAQVVAAAMPAPTTDTHVATVERIDENGTPWVRLAGAEQETPANGGTLAEVQPGQTVMARLAGGQLTLIGSTSAPSVGAAHVAIAVAPAMDKAIDAEEHAQRAADAAEAAEADAKRAHDAADDAQSSATRANTHAADALAQLTVVQDVAGTLDWIARHGTYVATTDTTVQPSTVYFELQGGDYVPVAEPSGSPSEHGWYVLDVADSQTDYIMAHLAVTSAGLWVLPAGMGQAATPQGAPGYKLLLASGGTYVYDANGHLVRSDTAQGTVFDAASPQYIGGENAYIVYYDSDNDGVPDSIRIGGSKVTIGGQPLSQVLADVNGTLIYDHAYQLDASGENATFTAYLYRGGVDVKTEYDPEQFLWYYKTESDDTLHPIGAGYGYTCTVSLALMGYGGHVVGKFVQQADSDLLTSNDEGLQDSDGDQLTVQTPVADGSVRVSDLQVATRVAATDKLLVSDQEGEHLATIETLQGYIESRMPKHVLFGTTAQWNAQVSLESVAETMYVYTDHATDSQGNPIAGVKVGDGSAYLIDLPFTDTVMMEHIADNVRHVTAQERAFWNEKVRCYMGGSESLVFTTS